MYVNVYKCVGDTSKSFRTMPSAAFRAAFSAACVCVCVCVWLRVCGCVCVAAWLWLRGCGWVCVCAQPYLIADVLNVRPYMCVTVCVCVRA